LRYSGWSCSVEGNVCDCRIQCLICRFLGDS
jgi:hypothetical protein